MREEGVARSLEILPSRGSPQKYEQQDHVQQRTPRRYHRQRETAETWAQKPDQGSTQHVAARGGNPQHGKDLSADQGALTEQSCDQRIHAGCQPEHYHGESARVSRKRNPEAREEREGQQTLKYGLWVDAIPRLQERPHELDPGEADPKRGIQRPRNGRVDLQFQRAPREEPEQHGGHAHICKQNDAAAEHHCNPVCRWCWLSIRRRLPRTTSGSLLIPLRARLLLRRLAEQLLPQGVLRQ